MVMIKHVSFEMQKSIYRFTDLNVSIYELVGFKIIIVFSKWVDNKFAYL